MRPTLAQMEAFYWIGRLGGFHAAARQLHLTQPTVSARITELEFALGEKLFARVRQRAELSAYGREILPSVERVLKITDEISKQKTDAGELRGLLRLGAVESIALFTLPILLPRLTARYPSLKIELTLDIGSVLNRKLNSRELDVAVLTDAQVGESVTVKRLGKVEYAWVASSGFQLPARALRPSDLRSVPILANPNPSTIFAVMSAWFKTGNVQPENLTMCNSLALMARLVSAGSGLAIMQPRILEAEIETGRIKMVPSTPSLQSRTMAVAYYASSRSYKPLIEMICDTVEESRILAPL